MFTIIVFIAGVLLGKNWEQVMSFVNSKLNQSKNSDGGVTRVDD